MYPRYSYRPHNNHRHPLYAHPLQELQVEAEEVEAEEVEEVEAEVEVEEVEAEVEADKQTTPHHPVSDSAETLQKYSQEKERKQTASSLNSNAIT